MLKTEQRSASANASNVLYPRVGELWDYAGRVAVIAGNMPEEGRRLWVMAWETGERENASLSSLIERPDRFSVDQRTLIDRFSGWAREGDSQAMWFLGWWFEAINHQRSVWYYVAALRAGPDAHKWAYNRIVADAHYAVTRSHYEDGVTTYYPTPDLGFLKLIPEMNEAKLYCSLWAEAVSQAEAAPEVKPIPAPVSETVLNKMRQS